MRQAWNDYLSHVPPTAERSVRNFLLAVMAEGRNTERDDTALDAAAKMPTLTCKLSVDDVCALLHEPDARSEDRDVPPGLGTETKGIDPRVAGAVKAVNKLLPETNIHED